MIWNYNSCWFSDIEFQIINWEQEEVLLDHLSDWCYLKLQTLKVLSSLGSLGGDETFYHFLFVIEDLDSCCRDMFTYFIRN